MAGLRGSTHSLTKTDCACVQVIDDCTNEPHGKPLRHSIWQEGSPIGSKLLPAVMPGSGGFGRGGGGGDGSGGEGFGGGGLFSSCAAHPWAAKPRSSSRRREPLLGCRDEEALLLLLLLLDATT